MKILIIGSKGFIGSHCYDYFKNKYDTWGCDIYQDADDSHYMAIDPAEPIYTPLFKKGFDYCINCSGAANVKMSLMNPLMDFDLNTRNLIRIFDTIREFAPNCRLLNISSAAVYGNPTRLPINTDVSPHPISPYGFHKMMAEQICTEYYSIWNIKSCSARVFSVYGPGLRKQIFWDIFHHLKTNDKIELWGTGDESRDFIYITDLVNALDIVLQKAPFSAETINVANGEQTTIKQVANWIEDLFNKEKRCIFNGQSRLGDPLNWEADISVLKGWGYSKKTDIKQGINNYYKWVKDLR